MGHNVAIIPARGGSKGIPKKNSKMLAGKPLVVWTIEAALASNSIHEVIVSTDDKEIANIAKKFGVIVMDRSEELAGDNVHAVNIVKDCMEKYEAKCNIIEKACMLLPTSPLRTAADIDNAFGIFSYYTATSVVGVCKVNKPQSSFRHIKDHNVLYPIKHTDHFEVQRQDITDTIYEVNGAMFIATKEHIDTYGSFHKNYPVAYVMNKTHSVDINDPEDFHVAECILRSRL